MREFGRRQFLSYVAMSGAALAVSRLAGCSAAEAQGATLRVTHFGGPYGALKDLVAAPFEHERLGHVTYDTEQPAIILSKVQAQRDDPPYDVVMMTRAVALRMTKAGLLSPLTQAEIPAMSEIYPQSVLPGGHGVAMLIDSVDVMYDPKKTTAPITSWLDLWRPDLRGKVVFPALPLAGYITYVLLAVARSLTGNERSVDDAFKKLKEIKPAVRTFITDPNQATQMIERGEIVAAPQYSARISNVMKANPQILRATPKEGVPAAPYDLCVIKTSPQQQLARKYINFVLTPKIQDAMASTILVTPVTRRPNIAPAAQRLVMSDFSKLWFPDEEYAATQQKEWMDRWQREIQS
jgi:putative spermidine/putrescine transport system substrate-binding protein